MITELSQTRLRHEEHFQHKRATMDILQKYPELYEHLGSVGTEFSRLLIKEDKSLETLTKSDLTKRIVECDRQRDDTTRGLFLQIKSYTHHFDRAIREEAICLQNIRNHYRGITDMNLDEQTATTYNLLQDLNERSEALKQLNLTPWVEQLAANNTAVSNLLMERDEEKAAQPVSRINEVRHLMDITIRALYETLNTFQRLYPEKTDITKCMDELNTVNKRFADRLAQRAGRRNATKKKENIPTTFDIK